jgi:hypothetical protein
LVRRESDVGYITKLAKRGPEAVFGDGPGQVSDEQRGARFRLRVAKHLSSLLGVGLTRLRNVDVDLSAVDLLAVHLGHGLLGLCGRRELDVRETTRFARVAVHLDSGRNDSTAALEFLGEPVIVDVPRETTDKDSV